MASTLYQPLHAVSHVFYTGWFWKTVISWLVVGPRKRLRHALALGQFFSLSVIHCSLPIIKLLHSLFVFQPAATFKRRQMVSMDFDADGKREMKNLQSSHNPQD